MQARVLFATLALLLGPACGPEPGGRDGSGSLTLTPRSAPIHSVRTWALVYEAGDVGIGSGGALAFRVWPEWGWASPQLEDPEAPGYVSFAAPGSEAELEASLRRDPQARLDTLLLRVARGRLRAGERVEIHFTSKTGPFAGEAEQLSLEVDGDGDGVFLPVSPAPILTTVPGEAGSLWVVPRSPWAGEAAEGRVEARASVLDRWDNLIRSRAVEGRAPTVRARDGETGLEGHSGRLWPAPPDAPRQLYWGDLHGHSAWSDGTGQPQAYYRYARDAAALDFVALTDHDAIGPRRLDSESWEQLRQVADEFHDPGRFVTLYGYEYTHWRSGHLTILSPRRELPLLSAADPETREMDELLRRLATLSVPVLAVPHHPGGSTMPFDWDRFDSRSMSLVEIFSVHGSSECFECPLRVQRPRRGSFVRDALLRGYRLAFIGSGDTHNGHPGRRTRREPKRTGLVGLWAEQLTRDGIWEALMAGRTFATTGSRTEVRLEREGSGFRAEVRAASQVALAEIVKGDAVVFRLEDFAARGASEASLQFDWTDGETPEAGDFYYLRVTETDGHMAWTSPVYVP